MTDFVGITPFKFYFSYVKKFKWFFIAVVLVTAIGDVALRLAIFYSSKIIDYISSHDKYDTQAYNDLKYYIIMFAIMSVLPAVFRLAYMYIEAINLPNFVARIEEDVFEYTHGHSVAFFIEEMSGRIISRVEKLVNSCAGIYWAVNFSLLAPLIATSVTLFMILGVNVYLALVCLLWVVLCLLISYFTSKKGQVCTKAFSKASAETNAQVVDSFNNAIAVKGFASFDYEKKEHIKKLNDRIKADKGETMVFGMARFYQNIYTAVSNIIFYSIATYFWSLKEISAGDFVLVVSLFSMLTIKMESMSSVVIMLQKHIGSMKDAIEFLFVPHGVVDKENAKDLDVRNAKIECKNISFKYKKEKALFNDFSLIIEAGEKVGLVGKTGSGKTTLFKLLSRYYDINSGVISIDGQDISAVSQESLRRNIAVIPQDPSLFNRSIMDNIRYARPDATDEEVIEASKKAYAHDFIMNLNDKYDAKVGERGVILSGGERQRIVIARAILKDAPILALDEATSALDSEAETHIQKAISEAMRNKTVIAIAHRLSTLRNMDKIVVMERGKIVEVGTHNELKKHGGTYAKLWGLQAGGFIKE